LRDEGGYAVQNRRDCYESLGEHCAVDVFKMGLGWGYLQDVFVVKLELPILGQGIEQRREKVFQG